MIRQECKQFLNDYNQDSLTQLFDYQREFLKRFHDLSNMCLSDKERLTRDYLEAIVHETSELREEIRWKSWKQYPSDFIPNEDEIRFEIADIMCFLMNLAIVWGLDGYSFFNYVHSKQQLNIKRQIDPKYGYIRRKNDKADKETKEESF